MFQFSYLFFIYESGLYDIIALYLLYINLEKKSKIFLKDNMRTRENI